MYSIAIAWTMAMLLAPMTHSHGIVTSPMAEFNPGTERTTYVTRFQAIFDGKFDGSPQQNSDTFTQAFKASSYQTLKDLVADKGPECGNSNPNVSRKAIPSDGKLVFQNPDTGEGFVPSHTGPCEVWIDDERVFQDDNCAGHFTEKPAAHLPVDFSACHGECMLKFYWLALHERNWQVYKNCIPLSGSAQESAPSNPTFSQAYASSSPETYSSSGSSTQESTQAPSSAGSTAAEAYPIETPSPDPTPAPSDYPTPSPTDLPTPAPSDYPTPSPTDPPTPAPTSSDPSTPAPTPCPSSSPSNSPTPTVTRCNGKRRKRHHKHHHQQH